MSGLALSADVWRGFEEGHNLNRMDVPSGRVTLVEKVSMVSYMLKARLDCEVYWAPYECLAAKTSWITVNTCDGLNGKLTLAKAMKLLRNTPDNGVSVNATLPYRKPAYTWFQRTFGIDFRRYQNIRIGCKRKAA